MLQARLKALVPIVQAVLEQGSLPAAGVDVPGEPEHLALVAEFVARTWRAGRRDGLQEVRREVRFDLDTESPLPSDALEFLRQRQALQGKWSRDLDAEVTKVLVHSISTGADVRTTMRALQRVFPEFGKARLENIARTEATTAYNQGRLAAFREDQEFVTGVQFHAILDSRTTTICQARNGLILRLDDSRLPANTPPLHYQCRSVLVPVDRIVWAKLEAGDKKAEAGFFGYLDGGPRSLEEALKRWDSVPAPLPGFGTVDGIKPAKPAKPASPPAKPKSFLEKVDDIKRAGLSGEQEVIRLGSVVSEEVIVRLEARGIKLPDAGEAREKLDAAAKLKAEHQAALKAYMAKLPDMTTLQRERLAHDLAAGQLESLSRVWGNTRKTFDAFLDDKIAEVQNYLANPGSAPELMQQSRRMFLDDLQKLRKLAQGFAPAELADRDPGSKSMDAIYGAARQLRDREKDLWQQIADIQNPAKRRKMVGPLEETLKAARKAFMRAQSEAAQANRSYCTEFGQEARKVLAEIRPLGPPNPNAPVVKRYNLKPGSRPNSAVVQHVDRMSTTVPTDWWAASNADKQTIKLMAEGNKRAHYRHSDGELLVPAFNQESSQSTALHEFAHRFETVMPTLDAVMIEFRNRRTQGEKVQLLRDITGISSYKTSEVTREDAFEHSYMGKDYGSKNSEILSMGLEALFHSRVRSSILAIQDPEYRDLILGALAGL